jgi:hypothetical protein
MEWKGFFGAVIAAGQVSGLQSLFPGGNSSSEELQRDRRR